MKNLLLLISFIGAAFISHAQCSAGAIAVLTGNPGEVQFTNQCTGSNGSLIAVQYGNGGSNYFTQTNFFTSWNYTYTQPGAYQYCITIYDSLNACSDTWCDSIYITSVPANCDASFSYTYGATIYDVNFDNSGSSSNVTVTESWDFGDGTNSTATNPGHTYPTTPGVYIVCHTVTDTGGQCTDTWCDTVLVDTTITPPPPPPTPCNASYYWYQDSSTTQTVIVINNSTPSSGGSPASLSYMWDFGDGTNSTQAYPTHVYNTLGTFYVCLTVTDNSNPFLPCTSTYCDSVYVTFKSIGFTLNVYPAEVAGISLDDELQSLSVYPNPARDIVFVEFTENGTKRDYILYDLNGKVMNEGVLEQSGASIGIETLMKGMYLLKVDGYQIVRLVKE